MGEFCNSKNGIPFKMSIRIFLHDSQRWHIKVAIFQLRSRTVSTVSNVFLGLMWISTAIVQDLCRDESEMNCYVRGSINSDQSFNLELANGLSMIGYLLVGGLLLKVLEGTFYKKKKEKEKIVYQQFGSLEPPVDILRSRRVEA